MSEPEWIQETESFLIREMGDTVTTRCIMRDIRDLNSRTSPVGKRELFAAMAMQGLMTMPPADAFVSVDDLAKEAVSAADALLTQLNDGGGE